ncbi:uncharacterized protein [Procambarus clarkii]|uniref:uncharacterized protein n=1 Tax=Procambarus clarkii TaxID=6728 RepID=UPI001E677D6E|nr:uncharacterized protein LOC123757248 [Procambarus clarkii]
MSAAKNKNKKELCCFCGIGHGQELQLGKLYTLDNITVHYYCMLFSSGLAQNGDDNEGILGFFPEDIEKEIHRGRKLSCCYCLKKGATIGCSEKKCRRTYHYACGLQRFAVGKFADDFRSYCAQHRDYQKGPGVGAEVECPICMEELIADPKVAVWAPCCKRDSWFHKICLQKLALSAGYFFKCPLCNDKETFLREMQNVGIFVPEKDASWELEPNAFSELLERPIHCDAPKCKCPDGRKSDEDGSRWEILLCNLCGSSGVHVACGGLPFTCVEWTCPVCADMITESVKRMRQEVRKRRLQNRNVKLKQNSLESTSHEMAVGNSQSAEETGSIYSDCSYEDMAVDSGICNETPCKRKLEVMDWNDETPAKTSKGDSEDTVLKLTYASDSDDEIDIELGEYQVPPHTIIRELKEHGEELPSQLRRLKDYAIRAQKRMLELRLTEAEMVMMAKESSKYKAFCVNKSDIQRFYRYSLPLEKMLQMLKLITAIFDLRKAAVEEAQSSSAKKQKKTKSITPNGRKCGKKSAPGTPKIKIPLLKSALAQSLIAAGKSPKTVEQHQVEAIEDCSVLDTWSMQNTQPNNMEYSSSLNIEKVSGDGKDVKGVLLSTSSAATVTINDNSNEASIQAPESLKTCGETSQISKSGEALMHVQPKTSAVDGLLEDQNTESKNGKSTSTKGVKQETQTLGACRKLSLEFASNIEKLEESYTSSPSTDILLDSSHRYENVLMSIPLIANTSISELSNDVEVEVKKCTNQKLANEENCGSSSLKAEVELGSAGKSCNIKGEEKLRQTVLMPFNSDVNQNLEPTKKKRVKSHCTDKNKYVQKTLSPFILKRKNPS